MQIRIVIPSLPLRRNYFQQTLALSSAAAVLSSSPLMFLPNCYLTSAFAHWPLLGGLTLIVKLSSHLQ